MTQVLPPTFFIFTALECEAKPLINFYDLKKEIHQQSFSIYKNNSIVLTITGVGKMSMAAAVGYTFALFPKISSPVIINIGIAGHKKNPVGDLFIASKITDTDSKKSFYPQLIGNNFPKSVEVSTLSKPCTNYKNNSLSDMEASAFYEIALKFSTNELIHCIKVVSDNESSCITKIRAKLVSKWIANHLADFEQLAQQWTKLSHSINRVEFEEYGEIIKQCHFSVSNQIKLKTLLQRWNTLSTDSWVLPGTFATKDSKEILKKLESDINCLELHL